MSQPSGIFVSEDVRASVERTMALIADASERGGGVLALDFTDALMGRNAFAELKARRAPLYEIRFTGSDGRTPFHVYNRIDSSVMRRYKTLRCARRGFPSAAVTPLAEDAAILRGEII